MDKRQLCKKVQAEEYMIQVVEATTFYHRLRFSLLASTWLPRPLAVFLWGFLHVILAVYAPFMLLGFFTVCLLLAIFLDVFLVFTALYMVVVIPFTILCMGAGVVIVVIAVWTWLVITCHCCTLPVRSPNQSVAKYILTAGGTLSSGNPQAPPAQPAPQDQAPAQAAACPRRWAFTKECLRNAFTLQFFRHVASVSFPYWRTKLGELYGEIVPLYDAIAI